MTSRSSGSKKTSPYLRFCRRVLEQRLLWVLFAAAIVGFLVKNVRDHGLEFLQWDLLLLSGFTTLVVGLHLAGTIPSRMRVAITRLKTGTFWMSATARWRTCWRTSTPEACAGRASPDRQPR